MPVAKRGGYESELSNSHAVPYPLRALWLSAGQVLTLSHGIAVGVPPSLSKRHLEAPASLLLPFCDRIRDLGYNAVVFGLWHDVIPTSHEGSLDALFDFLRANGIQVIVKPTLVGSPDGLYPHDRKTSKAVIENLSRWLHTSSVLPDAVLWSSKVEDPRYHRNPQARDLLLYDLLATEMHLLEDVLRDTPISLQFFLTTQGGSFAAQTASLLSRLSDDATGNTTLVFSSVAGRPEALWQAPHPLWDLLRRQPDVSATPFLPVVNAGLVGMGEGFWPILSAAQVDVSLSRMQRHAFAGAIHMAARLPGVRGMAAGCLWSAGQALVHRKSAELMADIWLEAYHPALREPTAKEDFAGAYEIAKTLGRLRGYPGRQPPAVMEWLRYSIDKVLVSINELKARTDGDSDYSNLFLYFLRDAKRIVVASAQRLGFPVSHAIVNDDFKPGFWTSVSSKPLTPSAFGDAVTFFDAPVRDEGDPFRATIHDDNCF